MIELKNVSLSYDGEPILPDISLAFEQNEFICVIGKNGSGKSTLLRAVAGLMPYTGNILLDGAELSAVSHYERAKRLSYLPQTRPIPIMDAGMLIAHGRYPHLGFSKTLAIQDRERVAYAAAVTDMDNLLNRELPTLSGGERQRAYIAMMVAQDAGFMLLDEPTAHLDIEHQLEVMELLKKLHANGKGVIMAAHDLPQAFGFATRVLLISEGVIAADGSPAELCENRAIASALGVAVKKTEQADELYSYRIAKAGG